MQRIVKTGKFIIKILPFMLTAVLIVVIAATGKEMSVDAVRSCLPDNTILAWITLFAMYALKSMSVVFPIMVLQVAAGMIFPFWSALILNLVGTAVAYTLPYIVGRFSGADATEKLMKKYPKMQEAVDFQRNSDWFISFILRAVSCLPADILSLYFGSIKIAYIPYIVASIIGTLPGLIPATIVGKNIMNPKSPEFIISIAVTVVSAVISVIIYYLMRNKMKKRKNKE